MHDIRELEPQRENEGCINISREMITENLVCCEEKVGKVKIF